jgi:hypothetical protein
MSEQPEALRLADALVYVGGYRMGGPKGIQINLKQKPCWFHRTMMRLCLGWEWVDA